MSQPTPSVNLRGAVDLSSLAGPTGQPASAGRPGAAPSGGGVPGAFVVDVTEATFPETVQLSTQVPVVIDLWAEWCEPCKTLSPILEKLAHEYGGRFQLAKVDVEANQQIAGAFQVQSIPSVVALVGGQPVPLFQGAYPEAQVRQVLDELLRVAAQNGVSGVLAGEASEPEDEPDEPAEPPLPPLHAEAMEAIERGDLDAAAGAYRKALKEDPRDGDARAALAQVELLARVESHDVEQVQAAAADATDVDAQLAAADVEMSAGSPTAAFDRLIALVRVTAGEERERVRLRLIDLFEVVGGSTPEVQAARRRLASALY